MFIFFSDGILDAQNKAGQLFGRTGIERAIATCGDQSAECVVSSIFKAAQDHASGVEPFDDETVVAIKIKGSPAKRK